jgi:benzodiazapine receptor
MRPLPRLPALPVFILAAFLPAVFAARFAPGAWYQELAKPTWTPPAWLFGPVWFVLYVTIGVAAWLVWRRARFAEAPAAWLAWGAQLALNGAWSWIFFGLRAPGPALIEIAVLWLAILATIVAFHRLRPVAAALLLPYLAWVGFATALNAAIWRLNG